MHRTGSTTRFSDEFFPAAGVPAASVSGKGSLPTQRLALDTDQLPTYDPLSDLAKKQAAMGRSTENAVHLIPVVLIACALILWFFSSPPVQLERTENPIIGRINNMTIDGDGNEASSGLDIGQEELDTFKPRAGALVYRKILVAYEEFF